MTIKGWEMWGLNLPVPTHPLRGCSFYGRETELLATLRERDRLNGESL